MRFFTIFFTAFSSLFLTLLAPAAQSDDVITLTDKGGLHAAYVVPTTVHNSVFVQLIVLSGSYDDHPYPSGTAHLVEHLAAFSSDATVLRMQRERDISATVNEVSTIYTNYGAPSDLDLYLRLSRAVLDRPSLPDGFAESEIDIINRETLLRERQSQLGWITQLAVQDLYGAAHGRAGNQIEDLPKLSLEAAHAFHEAHYTPSNVSLIISGNVDPQEAAALVAKVFGDTTASTPPSKPWLDQKPSPDYQSVLRVSSDRVAYDTLTAAKFIDFEDQSTSIDMQGAFFIAAAIFDGRMQRAISDEDARFISYGSSMYFSKAADVELVNTMILMPGVDLDAANDRLHAVMADLMSVPISAEEIDIARQKQVVGAQDALRSPFDFLWFLKNVAADGFPPITPMGFADILENTTDQEVIDFVAKLIEPAATTVVMVEKGQ